MGLCQSTTVSGTISTTGVRRSDPWWGPRLPHAPLRTHHRHSARRRRGPADGRLVVATEREHPDLFWAIRGGGDNFGLATSFLFRLHPVRTVHAGPTLWPIEQSAEVLRWYCDFARRAPEDRYGFFAFFQVPPTPPFPGTLHHRTMCGIVWCYSGPDDHAAEALAPGAGGSSA